MTTLKWYEGTITKQAQLRWYNGTITRTADATKKVRWYNGTITRALSVRIKEIFDEPSLEPGLVVTKTAEIASGPPGTVTWDWTHVSGPVPALAGASTATVRAVVPSVMPGDPATTVLGVTATIGGVTSPQELFSFTTLPQTKWVWDGTQLIGSVLPPF